MTPKKETALEPRDPFKALRQMSEEFDRMFGTSTWPPLRWSFLRSRLPAEATWLPEIDVFEKDSRLITKIDLPGLKKEDVKVEVTDGHLAISGERKTEAEEKRENYYRCERASGRFYRAVPLPEGVKLEDVKATFGDGVLEVSVPLPAKPEAKTHKVEVQDAPQVVKPAA